MPTTTTNKPMKPYQVRAGFSRRPERLLLLCFYDPNGISTVSETVAYMQSESEYDVTVMNLFEHREDMSSLALNAKVSLNDFDAIIVHNTIAYNVDNLRVIDMLVSLKLKDYKGAKILMKQDENFRFKELAHCIGKIGFDAIFTCLPTEAIEKVYPKALVGEPLFERMLTGYVTPTLRSKPYNNANRPTDIGYRGSIQPLSFGRLAFEKRKIGDDISAMLSARGLTLDISSQWEDRIGGDAWFDFLGSCKATLGSESGASVFDLDGDLDARCVRAEEKLGPFSPDHAYAEAYLSELSDIEGNVYYNQLSPRHFEAAATGTVQILYPGHYSGILQQGRHYLPLARDYSNLDEIVDFIMDEGRRSSMAETAYKEVILNKDNWIETFVGRVDAMVTKILSAKKTLREPYYTASKPSVNVLLLAAHEPRVDPRLGWVEQSAPEGMLIHQLGVLPPNAPHNILHTTERGAMYKAVARTHWTEGLYKQLYVYAKHNNASVAALQELQYIEMLSRLNPVEFATILGAPLGNKRNEQFKWYLSYFLDTTATLLIEALEMRGVDAIIATDLDTLHAALILKGIFGVPVFYDAHEYWPEADIASFEYEVQYWMGLEKRLTMHADYCQTVSLGLAEYMQSSYNVPFVAVPNCEPRSSYIEDKDLPQKEHGALCYFLFQGGFAEGRGIDLLVDAWKDTSQNAILFLRGPDNAYKDRMKQLASDTGLLGTRIHFPDAVREDELVDEASQADVGLIPYTPSGINYSHCCPNKMSQYMAAGLPIIANRTSFVEKTIEDAGCGVVLAFTKRSQLVETINTFAADADLRAKLGQKARMYFRDVFHWENMASPLYKSIKDHVTATPVSLSLFDYDRVALRKTNREMLSAVTRVNPWIYTKMIAYRSLAGMWHKLPQSRKNMLRPMAVRAMKLLSH